MKFSEYVQNEGFVGDSKKVDGIVSDIKKSAFKLLTDKMLKLIKSEVETIAKKHGVKGDDNINVDGLGNAQILHVYQQYLSDRMSIIHKPVIKDKRF